MPNFNVILAQTVRIYGTHIVTAESMAEAIEQVRAHAAADSAGELMDANVWNACYEPDYSSAMDETIVEIEGPDGTIFHEIILTEGDGIDQRIKTAEELRAGLEIVETAADQWTQDQIDQFTGEWDGKPLVPKKIPIR